MTENAPASIEIVTIDPSQGLGDTFEVSEGEQSLANTVILGAIVRDAEQNVLRHQTVTVDGGGMHKEMASTGNFWGEPHNVYYYPFNYTFGNAGDHTITFKAGDITEEITLKAV